MTLRTRRRIAREHPRPREASATIAEYEAYIATMNEIEERIEDDKRYPVIEDNKIKKCCKITLEISKLFIRYILYKDATKREV